MTPTEAALFEIHKSPIVRLEDICEKYFNVSKTWAYHQAAIDQLPVATFKLRNSRKAPRMVKLRELAEYLDKKADGAKLLWEASQLVM